MTKIKGYSILQRELFLMLSQNLFCFCILLSDKVSFVIDWESLLNPKIAFNYLQDKYCFNLMAKCKTQLKLENSL